MERLNTLKSLKDPNEFTLEEIRTLDPKIQAKVVLALSKTRRQALIEECYQKVVFAQNLTCSTPVMCADPKEPTSTLPPYTTLKIFSNLYGCLLGWQFEADLRERQEELEDGRR